MIKFIDICAGIGGFHLAFHNLGADCVFASEWDKYARKTYEVNFKSISPRLFNTANFAGDITTVDYDSIPDFDVLCAGFPCQPFSQVGVKKGFEDLRGTIFFHIANIIRYKKPKAIFLENVRHFATHDSGKTFATLVKTFEQMGYSLFYKIIRASDFGLPQHRPRLFIVGFSNKNIKFTFPEPITLKKTMTDIFGAECNKKIGFTLRVGGKGCNINDRRNWDTYMVNGTIKRIGINEGKAMMGFPENFMFPVSHTQAMKQLGNSVAIPAVQAVAKEILKHINTYYK